MPKDGANITIASVWQGTRYTDDARSPTAFVQRVLVILSAAKAWRTHTHTQNGATSSFRSVGLTTHLYSPGEKGSNIRERLAVPPDAMLTDSWSVWNGNFRAASTSSRTYDHNFSSRRHMRATWQGVEGAKGAKEVQREFVEVFFFVLWSDPLRWIMVRATVLETF